MNTCEPETNDARTRLHRCNGTHDHRNIAFPAYKAFQAVAVALHNSYFSISRLLITCLCISIN
ncbi:hypothetical protein RchiOBHm_Chr7g0214671 [Rosa chinensis]|uniref:Uncharacterized protein n=1 Tax=Rosa chinensis TaxID=74649 RepID=A0A2P6PB99_ROSCH|nr:hypothetical protein RchiOBHm_Chr7g0214671 [Rosa chinensis]